MKCKKCGKQIPDRAFQCPYCGKKTEKGWEKDIDKVIGTPIKNVLKKLKIQ